MNGLFMKTNQEQQQPKNNEVQILLKVLESIPIKEHYETLEQFAEAIDFWWITNASAEINKINYEHQN